MFSAGPPAAFTLFACSNAASATPAPRQPQSCPDSSSLSSAGLDSPIPVHDRGTAADGFLQRILASDLDELSASAGFDLEWFGVWRILRAWGWRRPNPLTGAAGDASSPRCRLRSTAPCCEELWRAVRRGSLGPDAEPNSTGFSSTSARQWNFGLAEGSDCHAAAAGGLLPRRCGWPTWCSRAPARRERARMGAFCRALPAAADPRRHRHHRQRNAGPRLADQLYGELYGLTERDGERRCPLESYRGRGSLMGWLRTTLAQRHVDHHRRTRREEPLEEFDAPAADPAPQTPPARALRCCERAIEELSRPRDAEERFLLAAYYLDGQTLLQIARVLGVHEATVSRKLHRATDDITQAGAQEPADAGTEPARRGGGAWRRSSRSGHEPEKTAAKFASGSVPRTGRP